MRRKRLIVLVLVGALVAGAITVFAMWWRDYPVHHFGVVEKGVLYRSGQPEGSRWDVLLRDYGIKTVVNLRGGIKGEDPQQPWWKGEEDFCSRNHICYVNLPVDKNMTPAEAVSQFLALVQDKRNQPVLVHCQYGSTRTGMAVAAYRIVVQGWSYDKAIAEARKYQFKPEVYTKYDSLLRTMASGGAWKLGATKSRPAQTRPGSKPSSVRAGS